MLVARRARVGLTFALRAAWCFPWWCACASTLATHQHATRATATRTHTVRAVKRGVNILFDGRRAAQLAGVRWSRCEAHLQGLVSIDRTAPASASASAASAASWSSLPKLRRRLRKQSQTDRSGGREPRGQHAHTTQYCAATGECWHVQAMRLLSSAQLGSMWGLEN
jgi:hypothetical protein